MSAPEDRYASTFRRILDTIPAGRTFTVDTIRDELDSADIPGSALGGLFRAACEAGALTTSGHTVRSTHTAAKGRRILEYRRRVTQGRAA